MERLRTPSRPARGSWSRPSARRSRA